MSAVVYHYLRNKCNLNKGIHPIDWYTFSNQIDYLKQKNSTLSLSNNFEEFLESYNLDVNKKKYLITFDDGLKEHFEAAKLLKNKNIKGIFAIIGCTIFEKKIPLVHKLHWLRSILKPYIFRKELESILGRSLNSDGDIVKKAKKMHIHDDDETATLKYNLNFILDYYELDFATSLIIKNYIDSEELFCKKYFLSIDEIININKMGHEISWHTNFHMPMTKLDDQEILNDLNLGFDFLNKINKNNKKHLCYPYGRFDAIPFNKMEVISSNFSYGWTLENISTKFMPKNIKNLLLQRITTNELFKNIEHLK